MVILYYFCFLPAAIWLVLLLNSKKIHYSETIISLVSCFVIAGIIHYVSYKSQIGDYEFWSGQVTQVKLFEDWTEKWEEAVYKTETYTKKERGSDGKYRSVTKTQRVFSHYEWRTTYHPEECVAYSNIETSYNISKDRYLMFVKDFGGEKPVKGDRSTFKRNSHSINGDNNDYVSVNVNNPIIPVTKRVEFENRLKAGSVWDKKSPPESLNIPDRPQNENPWQSDRLIGRAKEDFSIKALDQLNAILGPVKKVDLNIVGFNKDQDAMFGQYLESKWLGGNKNSLTICYGGDKSDKTFWAYCFGWSDSDICKKNLESIFLQNDLCNKLLEIRVKDEIELNYTKPDWHRFDYIQIQPGGWAWFWFLFCIALSQAGIIWWSINNNISK